MEKDPFPPLTIGVREATHKLSISPSLITHLLSSVLAESVSSEKSLILLSPQLLTSPSFSFVSVLHGLDSF